MFYELLAEGERIQCIVTPDSPQEIKYNTFREISTEGETIELME